MSVNTFDQNNVGKMGTAVPGWYINGGTNPKRNPDSGKFSIVDGKLANFI